MSDEPQNTEQTHEDFLAEQAAEAQAEPAKTTYVEFVGSPPYGTEFVNDHSVDKAHMRQYHDVDLGAEVVKWTKGKNGRFLVPADQMTPEAAKVLDNDPMFQVVEL